MTQASLFLNGKQRYVRTIRDLTNGTEITGDLKDKLITKFGKRLHNIIDYHNSINTKKANINNITMFKSSYCGLSIDIVVNTKV